LPVLGPPDLLPRSACCCCVATRELDGVASTTVADTRRLLPAPAALASLKAEDADPGVSVPRFLVLDLVPRPADATEPGVFIIEFHRMDMVAPIVPIPAMPPASYVRVRGGLAEEGQKGVKL